jgi:hypothetical protein
MIEGSKVVFANRILTNPYKPAFQNLQLFRQIVAMSYIFRNNSKCGKRKKAIEIASQLFV